ncbi:MAG: hypothetical protein V1914_01580 [archaeon]
MATKFKKLCSNCRKNYVVATWKDRYVTCYECEKKELEGEIKDPEMKKLFNIPEKLYMENSFLRSIKKNYLRYGKLTEKQLAAFKKTIKEKKD